MRWSVECPWCEKFEVLPLTICMTLMRLAQHLGFHFITMICGDFGIVPAEDIYSCAATPLAKGLPCARSCSQRQLLCISCTAHGDRLEQLRDAANILGEQLRHHPAGDRLWIVVARRHSMGCVAGRVALTRQAVVVGLLPRRLDRRTYEPSYHVLRRLGHGR